ncbi:Transcription factor jumonji (JmjC) domain protein [Quillaja saponaria]|uniref:Transcription factor jumonji (JmjC) domain protein n=1 Tax=Quillaja saponaria TaxID=32244 RepID=A0AAD7PE90_QUISA|nr:Transcription factor jumonji (JmjC) domain protein [Quillaja saponaria]
MLMGKGRRRAVEKGVVGQSLNVSSSGLLNIPSGPVYYPTEDEFKDPLEYIYKIRPEAEPYGICRIVPPKNWKPPFALDLDSFTFPTKTQAIHQLQVRPAACDSKTFELEYYRFLKDHYGKKSNKRVVFEGEELDLCKLFNAVKRYGGYDKVVKQKKWGEVSWFVRSGRKISECAKHVLCQLYLEHLYDYECYNQLSQEASCSRKEGMHVEGKSDHGVQSSGSKRKRRSDNGVEVKDCKIEEEEHDQICEQCKSGLHGEVMLLCDRCDKGWHIYCLSPPLKQVPSGNWYCFECLNSDEDSFGFIPGKQYSLEAFRRMADRSRKKWFGTGSVSRVHIEKKFWEIVEGSVGEVEVMYGSDLDTSIYGSAFPHLKYPRPQTIDEKDHCFYSMNYLHWGESKCWYSIPGSQASAFEKVMKSSLPDLFDAQPDLLFQLVTMLNPSVLQENGVPVYSVLQEPGNFVITFPRSYHGGFNLGFNCAEAVNFAPADWLPHGGFGAELYQQYHKIAVLSHEELLCVVAQSDCDRRAFPYLKKELLRIYAKEKSWREKLWRNGITKSSPMSPRNCPQYVGTEEDPRCIICQQYLYLSAVVCCCRPSTFVCLEHWEHLCECKTIKLRLLYRHSLAELNDLVLTMDKYVSEEIVQKNMRRQVSCSKEMGALTKKVKGGLVTFTQIAAEWLLKSTKILRSPFSSDAILAALRQAEQFLWGGPEINVVRDVVKNLIESQKSAEGIRDCLSKIENWSCNRGSDLEKVQLEYVDELLSFDPLPCNEPGHHNLKVHAEEARMLVQEIDATLSTCSQISELELLYSRACCLPVYIKESEKLLKKISSCKVWLENVRKCFLVKHPSGVELNILYKLKSEILELQIQLPETDMLMNLLSKAESCGAQCGEMLESAMNLKNVEVMLQKWDSFIVDIPELKFLRQFHADAVSWISRFKSILGTLLEREDQQNVVDGLNCILNDGLSLKIQVDELRLVEVELKKAHCRANALKVRDAKMSLDFIEKLMMEAGELQIDREKYFVHLSGVLGSAICWEEKARDILSHEAPISNFEDMIRASEDISANLPSLNDIKDALSEAKSWLKNSTAFLVSPLPALSSLLKVEDLQMLVSQSKLLKISLEERRMLEIILENCKEWEYNAHSLLQDAWSLFELDDNFDGIRDGLTSEIESLITRIDSFSGSGLSLCFAFPQIAKLQHACVTLQWCKKTLSFHTLSPSLEDVLSLVKIAEDLSGTYASGTLLNSLVNGVYWLKRAIEVICEPHNCKQWKLSDVEEVNAGYQSIKIPFPVLMSQLENAIQKHRLWQEQVRRFLSLGSRERSLSSILQLKELGNTMAFNCSELNLVSSEVEKVENWKKHCMDIVGTVVGDEHPLLDPLQKIKQSLDRSLLIYSKLQEQGARNKCICCFVDSEDQGFLACSTCKDCYHFQCLGVTAGCTDNEEYICSYCQRSKDESVFRIGSGPLRFRGKCVELNMLLELQSDAEHFYVWSDERELLNQIVEQALACQKSLRELVDLPLANIDEDIHFISRKLTLAIKAVEVAGAHDHHDNCKLELALARNSWKLQVNALLGGSWRPSTQQIQKHLKEGLAMEIKHEEQYMLKLQEVKCMGFQWAEQATKVALDSGVLGLDKVFELIVEGENLPITVDEELKLLKARSMLYCICRKPYNRRGMIACDECDEWYHFDCMKLLSPPDVYICPACKLEIEELVTSLPDHERVTSGKFAEPKTPSPIQTEPRKKLRRAEPSVSQRMLATQDQKS